MQELTERLEFTLKDLDSFLYSVSHDLRAPLRAIIGFSRILAEEQSRNLDAEGLRMLGLVQSEAQRMSGLLDGLLSVSRLGKEPVQGVPIDMDALVRDVFLELSAAEPARKISLNLQPMPKVIATPSMIRRVWLNLIGNAIKFTRGRERAEIEVGVETMRGDSPAFYIKDNGVGFNMAHADRLFGIFQRLHEGQDFEGIGIGLALVQRIIRRHGGRIWAEAEPDRGATFHFTLPTQRL